MSEPEFRITIVRILAGVKNRLESLPEEIKEVKTSQDEIKKCHNWAAISNAMVARMDEAEQRISDIEDKLMENDEAEKKRETKAMSTI